MPERITTAEELAAAVTAKTGSYSGLGGYTNGAADLGLTPIGATSYCAIAVGVHPDLPDVVVKVVDMKRDGFFVFAKAVMDGDLIGPEFPIIHSITETGNGTAVVLMERLEEFYGYEHVRWALIREHEATLGALGEPSGFYTDMHRGNFMQRGEQVVIIDPLGPMED